MNDVSGSMPDGQPSATPENGGAAGTTLHRLVDPPFHWMDRAAAWLADHASPVMVKEVRQSIKSRSFLLAYMLLLLGALVWSVLGMAISLEQGGRISGSLMLNGYLFILGFPLGIVVPLMASRSLSLEFEEDTLHLLSITTMSARQLAMGKLASAMAQMLLYLSVLAPCIAFTWLLRGVDIVSILLALLVAVSGSLCLASLGLLVGAMSRSLVVRMVLLVLLIGALVLAWYLWCVFVDFRDSGELGTPDIVAGIHLLLVALFLTTAWVCLEAAAGAIQFSAGNASTPVRLAMLVQCGVMMAAILGVLGVLVSREGWPMGISGSWGWFLLALSVLTSYYWLAMGTMLGGERGTMSARVRRSLPKTWIGRMTGSLLYPGGGRGYLFALSMMTGWSAALSAVAFCLVVSPAEIRDFLAGRWAPGNGSDPGGLTAFLGTLWTGAAMRTGPDMAWVLLNWSYAAFYLASSWLVFRTLVRFGLPRNPLIGLLVGIVMFILINLAGVSLHLSWCNWQQIDSDQYSQFLIPCVFWSMFETFDSANNGILAVIFPIAVAISFLAAWVAARELLDRPAGMPARVREEMERRQAQPAADGESIEDIFAARAGETG